MNCPYNLKKTAKMLFGLVFFSLFSINVNAAEIYINPATGTVDNNQFKTTITIDPKTDLNATNVTVYLKYDPQLLSVQSLEQGEFTTYNSLLKKEQEGVIEIKASNATAINGIKTIASVNFNALANTGFIDIQLLNTAQYASSVTNTTGTNLLSNQPTSSLLLNIPSTNIQTFQTQEASNAIPITGYNNNLNLMLLAATIVAVGTIFRKYAKSER